MSYSEDGSEFVSGEHVCGHNGSFRPFVDDGHKGNRCPADVAARLAALRAAALAREAVNVRRGLCRPGLVR